MKRMEPQLSEFSQKTIETSRCPTITSAHFRGRAKRYRLAAAIADSQLEARRLRDLALTFEKIADDVTRFEASQARGKAQTGSSYAR
jgi:hypothetical protein